MPFKGQGASGCPGIGNKSFRLMASQLASKLSYLWTMLQAFKAHIAREFPDMGEKKLLIGCSGGLDSVVLLHLISRCGFRFSVAHCNFRLRGGESDGDEHFVANLCKELDCPFFVTHFDTLGYVNKKGISLQMAARELRYHWFSALLNEHGLDLLLTAHHADDTLETFLINLSRGTGLDGLTGIPARGEFLARPLLPFSREQIRNYAMEEGLTWREDSSNEDPKYLRNKIRKDIVPLLRELHPTFMENFLATLRHLKGSSALLAEYAENLKKNWDQGNEETMMIPVAPLLGLHPRNDHLHLLFSEYGFDAVEVGNLLGSGSGKFLLSKSHRLIRDRENLLLQPILPGDATSFEFTPEAGTVKGPITLKIEVVEAIGQCSPKILYVDKETLNHRLVLRHWLKGDYFYPFGMNGRKKVSKFFKDEKLSMIEKESQWLLCSGQDIVWIVGLRADDRFRVGEATKDILKISWEA